MDKTNVPAWRSPGRFCGTLQKTASYFIQKSCIIPAIVLIAAVLLSALPACDAPEKNATQSEDSASMQTPREWIEHMMSKSVDEMKNGDIDALLAQLTPDKRSTLEMIYRNQPNLKAQKIQELKADAEKASWEILSERTDGDQSVVEVRFTITGKSSRTSRFTFIKMPSGWQCTKMETLSAASLPFVN